jgi:hypothetical protein
MNSGWTVYRNLSAHGAADLVAIRGKEIRMFDVKPVHQKRSPPAGSPISYILVKPDTPRRYRQHVSRCAALPPRLVWQAQHKAFAPRLPCIAAFNTSNSLAHNPSAGRKFYCLARFMA